MRVASLTTTSSLSLPADSYIYKIVHVNGNLAAISSDDSLRLLDLETLREIAGGVMNNVHDGVTCLQTVDHDPNSLLTAGRDAAVQRYDVRNGQKTMRFGDDSNAPYLSLASHGTNIAAGTELSHSQAAVLLWSQTTLRPRGTFTDRLLTVCYRDTRSPSRPLQNYVESHNDDVTEVRFHPTLPRCLLSGSTDGLVNIYDTSIADEDDALVQVQNHGSSINHAGFLSNSEFFALSHDETLSVYHLSEQEGSADEPSPTVFGNLRPKLDCEYIFDVILSGSGGVGAIVGAGSHSKQHLDLIPLRKASDWSFDPSQTIRLSGAHGEEIVRSIHVNHEDGTIFTAGEDGLVKAWRTSTGTGEEQEQIEVGRPSKKKKKKRSVVDGGNESGRFKPY
ncbi:MAG: hypothetical protein ALECFALPRED_009264 [Alectoria fallacina]|uniref:WD repeat-containing protein 89 n=1 Tax=Alectoria fallacina TaxID=1903189 RepID=A0A8H3J703_9LECA|nr:MAG: hypothetical protein ALECFALPRED_009264 [Alectoria fallacina]